MSKILICPVLMVSIIFLSIPFNVAHTEEGVLKWFFSPDVEYLSNSARFSSPVIGLDGTIYVSTTNSRTSHVFAISPDGYEQWRHWFSSGIKSITVGKNGSIYVVLNSDSINKLFCFKPNGTKKWEFEFHMDGSGSEDSEKRIDIGKPAVGPDGNIYINITHNYCYQYCEYSYIDEWKLKNISYAINPNGEEEWRFESYPSGWAVLKSIVGPDGDIYFIDFSNYHSDKIMVFSRYGNLKAAIDEPYSLNAFIMDNNKNVFKYIGYPSNFGLSASDADGNILWQLEEDSEPDVKGIPSIVLDKDNRLYLTNSFLYCINSSSGEIIWTVNPETNNQSWDLKFYSAPVVDDNQRVYAVTNDGFLRAYDKNGTELWKFNSRSSMWASSPVIVNDGTIYVTDSTIPGLYAINSGSGGLADSSWPMTGHDPQQTQCLACLDDVVIQGEIPVILTNMTPNHTIQAGTQASVYGTSLYNDITLERNAKADLINFPGQNTIKVESCSNLFTVSRSGTIVTFQGSDGTVLKIPATSSSQIISFLDITLTLNIYDNQVMIDDQVVTTTAAAIDKDFAAPDGCGAYVAPCVWKEFDCYNLAAIGKTTNDDPFTPSWRLIGGYWQWGRKGPDSSQWYDTNTEHFAHGPTGWAAENANHDSVMSTQAAPDDAWGGNDGKKTEKDPCPTNYRVPTIEVWDGVLAYNEKMYVGSTWSYPGLTNYATGLKLGDSLFLPAAGFRTSGQLLGRGYNGYYWSSLSLGFNGSGYAWNLYFDNGNSYIHYNQRRSGHSVRCIAE